MLNSSSTRTTDPSNPGVAESRDFRNALSQFGTGVAIITTCDEVGRPYGLTATSFNAVSTDPPMVLWSQGRSAPSHPVFVRAGRFAVNVLAAEQRDLAYRFARPSDDKFSGLNVSVSPEGLPLLGDTAAHFVCTTQTHSDGGDHCVFIARVDSYAYRCDAQPLFFWQGRMLAPFVRDAG